MYKIIGTMLIIFGFLSYTVGFFTSIKQVKFEPVWKSIVFSVCDVLSDSKICESFIDLGIILMILGLFIHIA